MSLNKPFTHGLMLKGAYTLSKSMNQSDNDGRATLNWNTPSELYRNCALGGLRSHGTTSSWVLRTRCRGRAKRATTTSSRRIVNDWQINGLLAAFSGTPFTVTEPARR